MDSLQQLQAKYDAEQDRILLRARTDSSLFEAWITRRFLKILLPILQGEHPIEKQPLFTPEVQAQHERLQASSQQENETEQPFIVPQDIPLIFQEPPLLVNLSLQGLDSESPKLILTPSQGEGWTLDYTPPINGALLQVLQNAQMTAEWDLPLTTHAQKTSSALQ